MWKSREDKLPPPSFFAGVVAHLQRAYPEARITRELMETLRPFLIKSWRRGSNAQAAAQMTCACDGETVDFSPVIRVKIAKGSVRPPKGVLRGEIFAADELRPPAEIERLSRQREQVLTKSAHHARVAAKWQERQDKAPGGAAKASAGRKRELAATQAEGLLVQAQSLARDIMLLGEELGWIEKQAARMAVAPSVEAPEAPVAAQTKPKAARLTRKPAAQTQALLKAVQDALPGLAAQLAREAKKR